jgi:hypothetical protein
MAAMPGMHAHMRSQFGLAYFAWPRTCLHGCSLAGSAATKQQLAGPQGSQGQGTQQMTLNNRASMCPQHPADDPQYPADDPQHPAVVQTNCSTGGYSNNSLRLPTETAAPVRHTLKHSVNNPAAVNNLINCPIWQVMEPIKAG